MSKKGDLIIKGKVHGTVKGLYMLRNRTVKKGTCNNNILYGCDHAKQSKSSIPREAIE